MLPMTQAGHRPRPAAQLLWHARGLRFLTVSVAGWLVLRLCWLALASANGPFSAPLPGAGPLSDDPGKSWPPPYPPPLLRSPVALGRATFPAMDPDRAIMPLAGAPPTRAATGHRDAPPAFLDRQPVSLPGSAGGLMMSDQRHWLRAMLVMAQLPTMAGNAVPAARQTPLGRAQPGAGSRMVTWLPDTGRESANPRLRFDIWALGRGGTANAAPLASGRPGGAVLGGSQFGLRAAWQMADAALLRAYGRISAAPRTASGTRGSLEAAAGLALRPLAAIPVDVHAEQRVRVKGVGRTAPALFVAGGVDDAPLGGGVRLSGYAQSGWVGGGGAGGGTWFADGQMSADRQIAGAADSGLRLELGALAAGAVQDGADQPAARRLDVGPRATLRWHGGDAAAGARLSLDWRARVAGNAAPSSGLALTLAAGF